MTLKEFLATLPTDQIVRISCRKGTNFIYIGTVGACDLDELDCQRRAVSEEQIELTDKDSVVEKYQLWFDIPVADRQVLEHSPGIIEPEHLRIRIEGNEGWIVYDPEMPPLDSLSSAGANRLAGAIYCAVADDLIAATKTAKSHKKGITKLVRSNALAKKSYLESWLRADPYGQIGDPESVIRRCDELARGRRYKKSYERYRVH